MVIWWCYLVVGQVIPCNSYRGVSGSGGVVLGMMGGVNIRVRGGCRGWILRGHIIQRNVWIHL